MFNLNPKERTSIEVLKSAIQNGMNTVDIPYNGKSDELFKLYLTALGMKPNPSYDPTKIAFLRTPQGYNIELNKIFTSSSERQKLEQYNRIVNKVLKGLNPKADDFTKAKYLYDYLVDHTVYGGTNTLESHSPYGALVNRLAVCDGISYAYSDLLNRLGIKAGVISGDCPQISKDSPHAWNIVEIDSQLYHVDVTWCLTQGREGFGRYDYFLLPDNEIAGDHQWDRGLVKPCNDYLNTYFGRNKMCAPTPPLINYLINKQLSAGNHIYIKVKAEALKEISKDWILDQFKRSLKSRGKNRSFTYSFNELSGIFEAKLD